MDQTEIHVRAFTRIDKCAHESVYGKCRRVNDLVIFLRTLVLPGFAKFFIHGPQNTIHKLAAVLAAECLCELNCFIDRYFGRHFFPVSKKKFGESDAEHVAINY